MADRDLSTYTEQDLLRDPIFDQSTLGHLATARPDLRPAILAHPNIYPELAEWLRAQAVHSPAATPADVTAGTGDQPAYDTVRADERPASAGHGVPAAGWGQPPAQATVAPSGGQPSPSAPPQAGADAAPGPQSPAAWSDAFRARRGREPGLAEYQAAVAAGHVPPAPDDSWAKVSAGAAQVADGAKGFYQNRVAPAAQGAARDFQRAVGDRRSTLLAKTVAIAGFVVPALALVAILPVFLPALSVSAMGMSESISFWDSGEGILLLIAFALTIAAGVTAIVLKATWARITAACLGIGSALVGLIDSIAVMAGSGDLADLGGGMLEVSANVGVGAVLLLILSILLLLAGIAMLLPTQKKRPRTPTNAWPPAPQQAAPGAPPVPGAPPAPGGPAQFGDYSRPPIGETPYGQIPPRPEPPQAPRA